MFNVVETEKFMTMEKSEIEQKSYITKEERKRLQKIQFIEKEELRRKI